MDELKISIIIGGEVREELIATSQSNMWDKLREVRDKLTEDDLINGARAIVLDSEGDIVKDITFTKQKRSTIEMPETKRVRRSFSTIILQKFDAKAKNLDEQLYAQFRTKLESLLNEFQQIGKKKVDKRRFKALQKFTKAEIRQYLKMADK